MTRIGSRWDSNPHPTHKQKSADTSADFSFEACLIGLVGLEPTSSSERMILSHLCLPFHHSPVSDALLAAIVTQSVV